MRKVRSRVTIFQPIVQEIINNANKALEHTAGFVHTEVEQSQVVPNDEGKLQGDKFWVDYADIDKGKALLSFDGPYARRLYYHPEYNFSTKVNPKAKGNWLEDWENDGSEASKVREAYKKYFEMVNR